MANLTHNQRLARFTLRGTAKVRAQSQLFCLVHNIEKLAHSGLGAMKAQGAQQGSPPSAAATATHQGPKFAPQSHAMETLLNQSPYCSSDALTRRDEVIGQLR